MGQPSSVRDQCCFLFPLTLDVLNYYGHTRTKKQKETNTSLPQDQGLSSPEPQLRLQAHESGKILGQSQLAEN